MKFGEFLYERKFYILVLLIILISCDILLMAYDVDFIIMLYVVTTPIIGFMICLIIEYNIKKAFYQKLNNQIKDLISEIIEKRRKNCFIYRR